MSQTYESYKNSGINWLSSIPTHWETKKLKHLANIQGRIGFKGYTKEDLVDAGQGALTIGAKHINKGNEIDVSEPEFISWDKYYESPEIMVAIGDIIFTQRGSLGKVAIVKDDIGPATINPSMVIFKSINVHPFFLYYFLTSSFIQSKVELIGSSTAVPMISQTQLGEFEVLLPSLPEQRAIATYLDRKTAQIDDLVARKEKLLVLLQQKRQAIINEAVTRGLDANAPKKDSSIEWLGEIPAHWEVKKLKYIASLKSGETITSETIDDEGEYPVYGGGGFRGYTSDFTHEGHYSLIGRQGALCGNINYAQGKFWASEHALVVSLLGEYETVWLGELLRSMNLNQYSQSSAQPGISADRIQNLHIPVPPLNEQRDIVEFILTKGKKIDQVITDIKTQLAYFKTYRQSLISEVVTGKVDVRSKVTADEQV